MLLSEMTRKQSQAVIGRVAISIARPLGDAAAGCCRGFSLGCSGLDPLRMEAKKQLDIRSLSSESPLSEKSLPQLPGSLPNDDDSRISEPIFSSSSSSSSSSTSSSLSSVLSLGSSVSMSPVMMPTIHQKKLPTRTESRKLVSPPARRKYNATTGLCILLVSLSVLVFSGKLCAILWTSTCLCLTPRRRGGGKPLGGVPPEVRRLGSLEGDKKRIVLEGFLDRNRKG